MFHAGLDELPKGRMFLDFEGVMAYATVMANDNPCGHGTRLTASAEGVATATVEISR